jgi:hypothetical protein
VKGLGYLVVGFSSFDCRIIFFHAVDVFVGLYSDEAQGDFGDNGSCGESIGEDDVVFGPAAKFCVNALVDDGRPGVGPLRVVVVEALDLGT